MLLLLVPLPFISAHGQEPRMIIRNSQDAVKVSSFEAVSTLTITDAKGNQRIRRSSMASMSFPDGTEKRIIKFIAPAEVKGTGILIFDYPEKSDDMWIYLPALRKTRRVVSSEKSKSFMGSEFSNADMTAPGLDDFSYRIIGEEVLDGKACYRIESVPASPDLKDDYGYSRSVSWIDKQDFLAYRIEYYKEDGVLNKTIANEEFRKLDAMNNKYMVTHMAAENHINGRSSEMVMDEISVTATDESYFTVAYLEKE